MKNFCSLRQCGVIPVQSFGNHISPKPSTLGIMYSKAITKSCNHNILLALHLSLLLTYKHLLIIMKKSQITSGPRPTHAAVPLLYVTTWLKFRLNFSEKGWQPYSMYISTEELQILYKLILQVRGYNVPFKIIILCSRLHLQNKWSGLSTEFSNVCTLYICTVDPIQTQPAILP